jgi:tetratricopeptide (TPR) repeat protein
MHPLHVESVAWISERKDVLSAFFWFLALYAYVRYAERPTLRLYLMTAAAFALGLMAKPMLVTFPFTLLLLDVWPLRRSRFPRTLWEKLPLFALSIASSIVTFFVQRAGGAIRTFPLSLRLENALISYAAYLGQTFWPSHLAVFYPYPLSPAPWQAVAALLVVAGISLLALLTLRTRPYLAVGWLWYLGTLVPVIGLVQVGSQSRADRYTYIPMTGIAIMLAWGAADAARKWPRVRNAVAWAGVVMSLACVVLTWRQTGYWKNSEELFQHSIDVTENNAVAELNLGSYLMSVPGRGADAVAHLQAALRIDPDNALAHGNLGALLENQPGRLDQAIAEFRTAVRLDPGFAVLHDNLANALAATPAGLPEAVREYQIALRLDPNDADTHFDFGSTLAKIPGGATRAMAEFRAALRLDPKHARARQALAESGESRLTAP